MKYTYYSNHCVGLGGSKLNELWWLSCFALAKSKRVVKNKRGAKIMNPKIIFSFMFPLAEGNEQGRGSPEPEIEAVASN